MLTKVKIFLVLALFGFNSFIFAQWTNAIQKTERYESACALDAFDLNNAAFVLNNRFSKLVVTNDGGNSWNKIDITLLEKYEDLNDLELLDPENIIVVSGKGRIFRTENGGGSWEIVYSNSDKAIKINYLEMFDEMNGLAVGDYAKLGRGVVILKTKDGGFSWTLDESNLNRGFNGDNWRRIDFVNMDKGYFYVSGVQPQAMRSSDNGGKSWDQEISDSYVQALKFADENFGVCVALEKGTSHINNKIKITRDAGTTWETTDVVTSGWGQDVEFMPGDKSSIFITDGLSLFSSNDAGLTWQTYEDLEPVQQKIVDIEATGDGYLWMLQEKGLVHRKNLRKENDNSDSQMLETFNLSQNYPNPFNPTTTIEYSLPVKSMVGLKVYDVLGKEISNLAEGVKPAGNYKVNFNAHNLSSGIYFYKLETSSFVDVKKMLLIK